MRLTVICIGPKRIISISGGLGLLQMVLEPNAGRCASEDTGLPNRCELLDPTWVGEGNEAYKGVKTSP